MRILHFSDIHYGRPAFEPSALFDKRLLGTFNYLFRRKSDVDESRVSRLLEKLSDITPDLIVCSGDITCVGNPAEFEAARAALLPFARTVPPFVYVPGNHDAYVRRKTCKQALEATVRLLNPPPLHHLLESGFASLNIGSIELGLLAQAHPTNILLSSGRMPEQALPLLQAWIKRCKASRSPAILIGHFPSRKADGTSLGWRRHLKGGDIINEALTSGDINLYLCGHIHSPYTRTFPSRSLECCTGSLTMKRVFSIIDIESGGILKHRYEKL